MKQGLSQIPEGNLGFLFEYRMLTHHILTLLRGLKMGLFPKLIWIILNLICLGLDIIMLFLLCRIASIWCNNNWFERFNNIGKGLVDALTNYISQLWFKAIQKHLSEKNSLFVCLFTVLVIRLLMSELGRPF